MISKGKVWRQSSHIRNIQRIYKGQNHSQYSWRFFINRADVGLWNWMHSFKFSDISETETRLGSIKINLGSGILLNAVQSFDWFTNLESNYEPKYKNIKSRPHWPWGAFPDSSILTSLSAGKVTLVRNFGLWNQSWDCSFNQFSIMFYQLDFQLYLSSIYITAKCFFSFSIHSSFLSPSCHSLSFLTMEEKCWINLIYHFQV